MYWGDTKYLDRSRESLEKTNPGLPIHVVELTGNPTWLDKALMYDLSPFETTLFLDTDTIVLGDVTYAIQKAQQHGIACCINECPWARRYAGLADAGDMVEYNTGVVAFSKSAGALFRKWKELSHEVNSYSEYDVRGVTHAQLNADQCSFALAISELGANPFVLPVNWNFRPRFHRVWFGDIKIWHAYHPLPEHVPAVGNKPSACKELIYTYGETECVQETSITESQS